MVWKANILTMYPDIYPGPLGYSLIGKALENILGLTAIVLCGLKSLAISFSDAFEVKSSKFRSLQNTYWFGNPGSLGRDRSDSDKDYSATTGDKIGLTGIIDEKAGPWPDDVSKETDLDGKDFIPFRFKYKTRDTDFHTEVSRILVFRAILSGITDTITPQWTPTRFVGRPDNVHVYQGADRAISFNFKLYPQTKQELKPLYQKLNALVGLCYPGYQNIESGKDSLGQRMVPPFIKVTIGNLFYDCPGFLSSLAVTVDDGSTWELDPGMKLPKYITVACGFTWVGKELPTINSKFYDTELLD